ncbi:hypothetical protein E2C01_073295 [Portunus trituberculatus]|uniref:Uncharacterized protein n=1 Tax=Portunus trituberculatus TaxID=210409 RepID=A0A5B7IBC1_PORTR|nr:hypothetical protein [Portunus trituberculatus]
MLLRKKKKRKNKTRVTRRPCAPALRPVLPGLCYLRHHSPHNQFLTHLFIRALRWTLYAALPCPVYLALHRSLIYVYPLFFHYLTLPLLPTLLLITTPTHHSPHLTYTDTFIMFIEYTPSMYILTFSYICT